jgi:type IV pilus assembly protein PilA
MHRTLLAAVLAVALTLAAGPAGAATRRAPTRDKAYCASFARVLKAITSADAPHDARTPAVRRAAVTMTRTAPTALAHASTTFGRAVVVLVDRGERGLRKSDRPAVQAASRRLGVWAARHCPAVARIAARQRELVAARLAQSSLRNGLTNAKGMYTDTDSYTSVTPTALDEAEPTLHFVDGPTDAADSGSVSVHVTDPTHIVMAAGTGHTCYYISDAATEAGTEFAQAPGAACDAASPPETFTTRWK